MKPTSDTVMNIILLFPVWISVLIGGDQPVSSGCSLSNLNWAHVTVCVCVCVRVRESENLRGDVKQMNKREAPCFQ